MKIAVLLSGGVDSSVALRLLHEEGHQLEAFYLKIWLEDELADLGSCPWEEDLRFARAVCDAIDVPLEVVSLQRTYHRRVIDDAIGELVAGRTPSPDVLCNRRIKFGAFLDQIDPQGRRFDRVASGHYARVVRPDHGPAQLLCGVDPVKDQSYFLYRLEQRQLARCFFPLGGFAKREVRALARRFALPNRNRPDSQGICFLGKIPYAEFVRRHLGERPGEIRELETGRLLGRHRGPWFHTVGQRKGLGLGGGPWYVASKDVDDNVVWVVHGEKLEARAGRHLRIPRPHWIADPVTGDLAVKLRHGPTRIPCRVRVAADGDLEVALEKSDPGLADGQPAVLYRGQVCLGGGPIVTPRAVPDDAITSSPSDRASSRSPHP